MREIIHENHKGHKFVAVGNRLHFAKADEWKTFTDFLIDYPKGVLGSDWGQGELSKPFDDRHQVLKWYDGMCKFQRQQKRDEQGLYGTIPNGDMAAYVFFSYDLYTLRHNAAFQESLVDRLRKKDQFQGVRYELFVAATFVRAGFDVRYEDESDRSTKHPEFLAIHQKTQEKICVEAKSRHRQGVLDFPGQPRPFHQTKADIGRLLSKALRKAADLPLAVFVDLNLPPSDDSVFAHRWVPELDKTVSRLSRGRKTAYNLLVFTNHPHHYGRPNESDPRKHTYSVCSPTPQFPLQNHGIIDEIVRAALQYGRIPSFFPDTD